jgi:dTMP kinase
MYIIFEGNDGSGKSSTMHAVAKHLSTIKPDFNPILTQHPGSTPLGQYIRSLVKYPEKINPDIKIDKLTRQLLYMADTVNFIKILLEPAIQANQNVMADRSSFISALVYGLAEGLSLYEVTKLFDVVQTPRADRLYVLQCPWQEAKNRINKTRIDLDHFDKKQEDFFARVEYIYNNLLTADAEWTFLISKIVALQDVIYVDTTMPQEKVVEFISHDILKRLEETN